MAVIYPELENIERLKVPPTPGEWALVKFLNEALDDSYEVFFNPYLDGDRPDIVILKEYCAVFIIEVKDWNLSNYTITENNNWELFNGTRVVRKASPNSQAFRYKKNLYDLHLPVIGLARLTNPNFYKLVDCFVYFHGPDKAAIDLLYYPGEEALKAEELSLHERFHDKKMSFESYEKARLYLNRKKGNLQRDKRMSFCSDQLPLLIKKIKKYTTHVLFDDEVYRDFKRRLSPPMHTLNQGVKVEFDKRQLSLTNSENSKGKVMGVAGCGKTSILAQRALNAFQRHNSTVLILTFNITLKNYIRDKLSDLQGNRDFSNIEISNYHQFYNSQINNTEQDISDLIDQHTIENLYSRNVFKGVEVTQYKTILIDEIQDYQPEWVKIIRDNFLHENGEMMLFGDQSQDIYQRNVSRAAIIAQGFGKWLRLKRSYRTNYDSPLNQLFKNFQVQFLVKKDLHTVLMDVKDVSPAQIDLDFSLLKYEEVEMSQWKDTVLNSIKSYIRGYELHPNDVVILSSRISLVRQLNERILEVEKTHCMFETYEELSALTDMSVDQLKKLNEDEISLLIKPKKDLVERVRRTKKSHFYANSGLIKLSTIHSYKGLESDTVFYLMGKDDEAEVLYTSITRSSKNLVVFDIGGANLCSGFMKGSMKGSINTQ
ncbi:MAG: GTPase SAR1 family protein [Arenicella sp.]|jgi:GTPase SAR1 family protein